MTKTIILAAVLALSVPATAKTEFPHRFVDLLWAPGMECRDYEDGAFCHMGKQCNHAVVTGTRQSLRIYRAYYENEKFAWCGRRARGWR